MPVLSAPDVYERRTKSWNPAYFLAATAANTTSVTRRACDIYEEIENGEASRAWTMFQLERANELRALFRLTPGNEGGANVFNGGHLVLNDECKWYYYWISLIKGKRDLGYERWSSHYDKGRLCPASQRHAHSKETSELQFEIYFPWNGAHMNWGCFLFGRYQEVNGTYVTQPKTWFQTEAHASTRPGVGGTLLDPVAHIATGAVPYFMTFKSRNVGPRGFSKYTELNPLRVDNPPDPPVIIPPGQVPGLWDGLKVLGASAAIVESVPAEDIAGPLSPNGSCGAVCVQCKAVHGRLPALWNYWHRCSGCGNVYCPNCGDKLKGNRWTSCTRDCPECGKRTVLFK